MIYVHESETPTNFFSPSYKYFMYENTLNINPTDLKNFILKIEKDILKKTEPHGDGLTGLGNESLTSRHMSFNLFDMDETKFLTNQIKHNYFLFLDELQIPIPDKTYGKCWANVMREGEQIKKHRHETLPSSYLSGHLCVETNKTNTYYVNPFNDTVFISENKPGKITLFPSWIEHGTDVTSSLRITLAFDLVLMKATNANWKLL
tara:strand:- start:95 stop:709 length:615 start_codon:yes stop_codon:yes gene_type:complete